MADKKRPLEIHVDVAVKEPAWDGRKLQFSFTEQVPMGKNPILHMRERINEEIDRNVLVEDFSLENELK